MPEHKDPVDEALASYATPQCDGLEQRILARIEAEPVRHNPAKRAAIAMCALAAAVCGVLLWQPSTRKTEIHPAINTVVATQLTAPSSDHVLAIKRKPLRKRRSEPKLQQFPTPVPAGDEERALLQLASSDPKNIPPELIHPDEPVQPIQVAPVEIKPLD